MAFLVTRTEDTLANTFEFVLGNVDLEGRRLTPFTDSVAEAVERRGRPLTGGP